ncbi:hypothetical protein Efla_001015 [Eimeria flavescens]
MGEQLNAAYQLLSPPHHGVASGESEVSAYTTDHLEELLRGLPKDRRLELRGRRKVALAVFASVTAVILLMSLCVFALATWARERSLSRWLSISDESSDSEPSPPCGTEGAASEEAAFAALQQPVHEEDLEPPAPKAARLETAGTSSPVEEAARRRDESNLPPKKLRWRSPRWFVVSESFSTAGAHQASGDAPEPASQEAEASTSSAGLWVPGGRFAAASSEGSSTSVRSDSSPAAEEPSTSASPPFLHSSTSSASGSSQSSPRSVEKGDAAEALLLLQIQPSAAATVPAMALGSVPYFVLLPPIGAPAPGATSSVQTTVILTAPYFQSGSDQGTSSQQAVVVVRHGNFQIAPAFAQQIQVAAPVVVAVQAASATSSGPGQPSTSFGGTPSTDSQGREHPYIRAPRVLPSDIQVRLFDPSKAVSEAFAIRRLPTKMNVVRALLTQDTLQGEELYQLATMVQQILSYAFLHEGASVAHCHSHYEACVYLGRRFLVLEQAMTALQVLREDLNALWWRELTNRISHECKPVPFSVPLTPHQWLAYRLSEAIRLMKEGLRPSKEEILELKMEIFFASHAPAAFRRPRWDPWRKDHSDFVDRHLSSS